MNKPFFAVSSLCLLLTACGGSSSDETPATLYSYKSLASGSSLDMELYRIGSDGSAEFIKNLNEDGHGYPGAFTELNSVTYFVAQTDSHGKELWRTDGTQDGTYMVQDLHTGSRSGIGSELIAYNGAVYFRGNTDTRGTALWRLENEQNGPEFVINVRNLDTDNSGPSDFFTLNGDLFFHALAAASAPPGYVGRIFRTDGTAEGTQQAFALNPYGSDAYMNEITLFDGRYFFPGATGTVAQGGYGYELAVTNGTEIGTYMVADINQTSLLSSESRIDEMTVVNDLLIFSANDAVDDDGDEDTYNEELWISDGTTEGTAMLKNLSLGSTNIRQIESIGDRAYISLIMSEESSERELWTTTGSAESLEKIGTHPGSLNLFQHDGLVGYTAWTGEDEDYDLVFINPNDNSLIPIHQFDARARHAFSLGDRHFFFSDTNNDYHQELWSYTEDEGMQLVMIGDDTLVDVFED